MSQSIKTIFSGMRPSGKLHIGNYLGALKNWVILQDSGDYRCFFMIADLHAMSEKFSARELPEHSKNLILDYLACGLNPEKSVIFIQSHVPEHTYLSWIFSTLVPIAELKRMHQFKEKAAEDQEINAGLFTYPILQAADILLYKADTVPVGEDQVQHVELTRVIAKKFNNAFGQTFPEAQALLTPTPRVMSLTEPTAKMSKSKGEKNYIALSDDPAVIRKKIMSAVTDTSPDKTMTPGVANLFRLLETFASAPKVYSDLKLAYDEGSLKYQELKMTLAEELIKTLAPIQERRQKLADDPSLLAETIINGNQTARKIAAETMQEVREKTGLIA